MRRASACPGLLASKKGFKNSRGISWPDAIDASCEGLLRGGVAPKWQGHGAGPHPRSPTPVAHHVIPHRLLPDLHPRWKALIEPCFVLKIAQHAVDCGRRRERARAARGEAGRRRSAYVPSPCQHPMRQAQQHRTQACRCPCYRPRRRGVLKVHDPAVDTTKHAVILRQQRVGSKDWRLEDAVGAVERHDVCGEAEWGRRASQSANPTNSPARRATPSPPPPSHYHHQQARAPHRRPTSAG